ncbi:MAG: restriction endonuclease subunit S [Terrimicrobiaceae bacterium]
MPAATDISKYSGRRLLQFVRFATMEAWAYAALFDTKEHAPTFPVVALGELIAQRKGFIQIDDAVLYKRCRVQLRAQGIVLRDEVLGSGIKTKSQQVCREGDFLVAEIDAKLGGFGLVSTDLEGAVVSSHYFLFEADESRLSREYLALCLTTQFFQKQVQATGSTNYAAIRPHHVLGYRIPLPSLAEQKHLVATHAALLAKAEAAEACANARKREATRFLESALGLQAQAAKPDLASGKLHFVRFAKMERWGDIFHGIADTGSSGKYPMVRLGDIVADLQNGWSPKCHSRRADVGEWGVLKLGAVSFGEYDESQNKALPSTLNSVPEYEICAGDVLISRANITQYVGACVYVAATRPRLILCDKIFRVSFLNNSQINGRFLAVVMKTHPLRHQIEKALTGTSPTMKNITKPALLNLRLPLPPLPEQERIVARLDELRAEVRAARAEAAAQREAAAAGFSAALFAAK